ncbi:MAG: hypothetical protein ACREB5_09260 [Sphingomonadaceae bacterium]
MLRKMLLGVAAAATLGGAVAVSAPASAQSVTFSFGSPGYYGYGHRPVQYGWGGGYYGRPHYGSRPDYGYGRPHYGPRCYVRPMRYWDGWGWAVEHRRICR